MIRIESQKLMLVAILLEPTPKTFLYRYIDRISITKRPVDTKSYGGHHSRGQHREESGVERIDRNRIMMVVVSENSYGPSTGSLPLPRYP